MPRWRAPIGAIVFHGKVFHGIDKSVFHNIAVEIKIGVVAEDAHKLCSVRIFGCGFSNNVLIVAPINDLNTHNCIVFTVFAICVIFTQQNYIYFLDWQNFLALFLRKYQYLTFFYRKTGQIIANFVMTTNYTLFI